MYVIRDAQEPHRNVKLHLYRKVCLLVHSSIFVEKVGQKDASISWSNLLVSYMSLDIIVMFPAWKKKTHYQWVADGMLTERNERKA